jgi:putative inorganic carbon (hco3(-)) transporter
MEIANKNNHVFTYLTILVLAILPLIISSDLFEPALANRYLAVVIYLLLFFGYFFYYLRKGKFFISASIFKIFIPAFLFLLWSILSLLFSFNPIEGILEISKYLLYSLLILSVIITVFYNPDAFDLISKAMIYIAIFHCIIGILQFLQIEGLEIPGDASGYIFGFNANANLFGSFIALLIPFVLYYYYNRKVLNMIVFVLANALIALIIAQTRASWVSTFIVFLFITILIIKFNKIKTSEWLKKIGLIITFGVILFTLLLLSNKGNGLIEVLGERIISTKDALLPHSNVQGSAGRNVTDRILLWKKSIFMIKENPILGVGRGNWKTNFGKYGLSPIESFETGKFAPDVPHNVYLYILCETGVIGLILLLIFILGVVKIGYKNIETNNSNIFLLSGLLCFGIDSVFSFADTRVEHMVILSIYIGLILGHANLNKKDKPILFKKNLIMPIIFSLLLFCLKTSLDYFNYDIHYKLANESEMVGNYSQILEEAKLSKSALLSLAGHPSPIENLEIIAHKNLKNFKAAEEAFNIANCKSPFLAQVHNNIGTSFIEDKQFEKAKIELAKALYISPQYYTAKQNIAILYYYSLNYDSCLNYLAQIDLENPPFFTDILKNIALKSFQERKIEKSLKAIELYKNYEKEKLWFKTLENQIAQAGGEALME